MTDVVERLLVRHGSYRDSVTLMLASNEASGVEGVVEASAVAATPLNVEVLTRAGFELAELGSLEPTDLVVAIRAESEAAVERGLGAIDSRLIATEPDPGRADEAPARSLAAAARRREGANLAMISVPGPSAAYECAIALEAGLHAFCFSSGFDISLERELKLRARELGLLMMGPDCGTAILDGHGIGFANELDRGPVGIVGASGTGMQQVGCLLDRAGVGLSQAIGVGGRDFDAEVDGQMALEALRLLADDPGTTVLVVIAKAPAISVVERVAEFAGRSGKPAVLCFPGLAGGDFEPPQGVELTPTLEAAAEMAAGCAGRTLELGDPSPPEVGTGLLRGMFCGGTLRDEALTVITARLAALGQAPPLALSDEPEASERGRDLLIDYGSERLTAGRAHPMIDPSLRNAAVARHGTDPDVGVLLIDVVLGRAAHPDPAGELAPAIESALGARGDELAVVVSLCGSRGDFQGLELQAARLREAGATVVPSNAGAARIALAAARGRSAAAEGPR